MHQLEGCLASLPTIFRPVCDMLFDADLVVDVSHGFLIVASDTKPLAQLKNLDTSAEYTRMFLLWYP
jgi:hypothetical protein